MLPGEKILFAGRHMRKTCFQGSCVLVKPEILLTDSHFDFDFLFDVVFIVLGSFFFSFLTYHKGCPRNLLTT